MAIIRRQQRENERGLARPRDGWDPFESFRDMLSWDPFEEMRRVMTPRDLAYLPLFDVKETKSAYVFKADLPGVKEGDLDVSVTGNRITVSGKREEEEKTEDERYYAYERRFGTFSRSFTLPEGVDLDAINAELKNGELMLHVPKKAEHQPKRIPLKKAA